jgi:putative acetyltransferase
MSKQNIEVRRLEPEDYKAIQEIHSQARAVWGTLQLPFPSVDMWKKRLAEQTEDRILLGASVDGAIVGSLSLSLATRSLRRRHVGELGMAVHDDWQGRGVGTALMSAAVELADR